MPPPLNRYFPPKGGAKIAQGEGKNRARTAHARIVAPPLGFGGGVKKFACFARNFAPPLVQVFSAPVVICRVNTKITSCGADATCNLWVNTFSRAIFLVNVLKSECSESMFLPMLFSFSDSIKLINTFIKPVLGLKIR